MNKTTLQLRLLHHYLGTFFRIVRSDGWSFALRRAYGFLHSRSMRRHIPPLHQEALNQEPLEPSAISSLISPSISRPLLLIVSDTQIRQCIHYRISQKIRYLQAIGLNAMHVSPAQQGRMRSFMKLAHTVIIYRTVIDPIQIKEFRNAGLRVVFEFDDLVVGRRTLHNSGILTHLSKHQSHALIELSGQFLETAQLCDEIIVSTPYLSELYRDPQKGLAYKPFHIIPNFVESKSYSPPGKKDFTFAYTSPSGSIKDELKMLSDFLCSYDRTAEHDWNILVMGNDFAFNELSRLEFARGKVLSQPFVSFDGYLQSIAQTQTVLIPLSDNHFNRSKTAIRLMDAAISGTQALFSPVGAYQSLQAALINKSLCVTSHEWGAAGKDIAPILAQQETNVVNLQDAVRALYGHEAAIECYRDVFIERMQLQAKNQKNMALS